MNLSQRIAKVKNETKALKAAQPLNFGVLTKHSITAFWSGTIDRNSPISKYSVLAAFEVKFRRTDGVNKPPFVQFTYKLTPDKYNFYHSGSTGIITGVNAGTIFYKIILEYDFWWPYGEEQTTGDLDIEVNAFSPIDGELTIERVYS